MTAIEDILNGPRPDSIAQARAAWPECRRSPSPDDWRDQVLYFLLPDRFSDSRDDDALVGHELDLHDLTRARGGKPWRIEKYREWGASGMSRFQGGTLRGVVERLPYLKDLGMTTLWIGPVWKQRREGWTDARGSHFDEFHGYAIQDFFDVDPRFGTRADLVELVAAAHAHGLYVILDIVFNHSGRNFVYSQGGTVYSLADDPQYQEDVRYDFGGWLDGSGQLMPLDASTFGPDDAVWPIDLRNPDAYHRRGEMRDELYPPGIDDRDEAPFRRADMYGRDFDLQWHNRQVLETIITCWTYWMALTDCDGFRIDTLKHVAISEAVEFTNSIKSFARGLDKEDFFLVGEVAASDAL